MKKINILQINGRSDIGGGPKNVFRLLSNMDKTAFNLFIACPDEKPFFEKLQGIEELTVFPLELRKLKLSNLFALMRIVRNHHIDIVHSQGKAAGLWSRLLKIFFPSLVVCHHFRGIHYKQYSPWKRKLYFAIERLQSCLTTQIIHVSESEKQEALDLKLCPPEKQIVLANGIEIFGNNPLSQTEARKKLELPEPSIIVTIARFSIQKNLSQSFHIIKALVEKEYDLRYIVIGGEDDISWDTISGEVKELELSSHIILAGEQTNIIDWLCAADIYLSTARWEGLPTAVLEAMSVGLPIVASDVVGNKSVVVNGVNGFLVPLNNTNEFTACIEKLLLEPDLGKSLGSEAKKAVLQNFSVKNMVTRHEELYKNLFLKSNQ